MIIYNNILYNSHEWCVDWIALVNIHPIVVWDEHADDMIFQIILIMLELLPLLSFVDIHLVFYLSTEQVHILWFLRLIQPSTYLLRFLKIDQFLWSYDPFFNLLINSKHDKWVGVEYFKNIFPIVTFVILQWEPIWITQNKQWTIQGTIK